MTCNRNINAARRMTAIVLIATAVSIPALAVAEGFPTAAYGVRLELSDGLAMPSDVAVGKDGRIYVVSGGNHEVGVFDGSGKRLATLGGQGSEPGQLFEPVGIGIGPKGEIYVADKGNERLQVFSSDGQFRRELALEEDGEPVIPVDVAVSADGRELFVTTNNSHRVLVFASTGKFLRGWGGEGEDDGQFRYPATLVLDAGGNVLVVDVLNQRVQKFDPQGNFLGSFGGIGGKPGTLFRPKGIAVDAAGRSYVSDSFLGAVQVFDADGEFACVVGDDGAAAVFETPVGMTVDGTSLLVVQMLPGKVLKLDIDLQAQLEPEATP
jgi:tripartite motif-containing protein 71